MRQSIILLLVLAVILPARAADTQTHIVATGLIQIVGADGRDQTTLLYYPLGPQIVPARFSQL
jgi:hypothetical protein